ncbi:MAG: L-seryl-tRNA(Sec) selenium transferase, partial [Gemmatimonadaceae bacterium]
MTDLRRALPAVHTVLERPRIRTLLDTTPRGVVLDAVRAVLDRTRAAPAMHNEEWLDSEIVGEVARRTQSSLRAVFNATGVVLH